ncbi:MAG TPA: hypothetical protein ENN67_05900 [Firmicutes bacterium]|nr:hypothetical protein [Bacillota bacterium]
MRIKNFLISICLLCVVPGIAGCPSGDSSGEQTGQPDTQIAPDSSIPEQFRPAENLARRVVVYSRAYQEGDLAPFFAHPDDIADSDVPHIAKLLNRYWWDVDFDSASLSPLGTQALTELEREISKYLSVRLDESGENDNWVLFTVGFDPVYIRAKVVEAHPEWSEEQRALMLTGTERGCVQVWCGFINGEWKILSHLDCPDEISRPTPPQSPNVPLPDLEGA